MERGLGDIDHHQRVADEHAATKLRLLEVRQPYVDCVDSASEQLRESRAEVKKFRSDKKLEDKSLYSRVDKILEKYDIHRSAYHSGQINGVDIKLLMDNTESIMMEVESEMLSTLPADDSSASIAAEVKKMYCFETSFCPMG